MRLWIGCLALVLLSSSGPASAGTLREAKEAFEQEDARLNALWGELKATLKEWEFKEVLAEQRKWLEYRDAAALEEAVRQAGADEGKEKTTAEYWDVRALITASRTRMLGGFLNPGKSDDWSGEWIDGYGGIMKIVQQGDVFHFTIHVVRGPTYHLGGIAGKAEINHGHARFSDEDSPERESLGSGRAWLDFKLAAPRIEVSGVNTHAYHGARAYFDGMYVRVAQLSDDDAAKVRAGEVE